MKNTEAAGSAGQMQSSALVEIYGLIVVVKKLVNGTCQKGIPWVDYIDVADLWMWQQY